ncbi:hypothetical protein HPB50_021972 [Hyalomma asiaticum]|uniref:Uncharacterized protein n=1 Tax=Hyalomma asiaticum TaxID=266040 RepID=A0ACB7TR94_HYAAI|nr:hypothetical protein HPB50_021972 [Hyalomma asiaticum]
MQELLSAAVTAAQWRQPAVRLPRTPRTFSEGAESSRKQTAKVPRVKSKRRHREPPSQAVEPCLVPDFSGDARAGATSKHSRQSPSEGGLNGDRWLIRRKPSYALFPGRGHELLRSVGHSRGAAAGSVWRAIKAASAHSSVEHHQPPPCCSASSPASAAARAAPSSQRGAALLSTGVALTLP